MADSKDPATPRTIKVTSIQQKPTAKGKTMWTITDDKGEFYSVFDEFVRARLAENQTLLVMVETAHRGDKSYRNIVGVDSSAVAAPGDISLDDIMPGAPAAPLQTVQQRTPAAEPAPPAPTAQLPTKPLGVVSNMVDIRIAALAAAARLCAGGVITAAQIEHNCKQFENYILGITASEHNSSSESEAFNDFVA